MKKKYIFVTGGVLSSLGKGLSAAALGAVLEARGLRVTIVKMDPYINVDPGTMSPYQHGEVFVTDDGAETDLDLGHYERFITGPLTQRNNFTTGRVYNSVISRERKGEYLGRTVQVIPHITDEIKRRIHLASDDADLCIVEVGGTVGDIEGLPFLEAIRQFRQDVGQDNVVFIHLTLVPFLKTAGELKTKPTQHSVKELLQSGIQPDMLFCRCEQALPREIKQKIARFCNLSEEDVVSVEDVSHIYYLPVKMYDDEVDARICSKLGMWTPAANMDSWRQLVVRLENCSHSVSIAIVGKYIHLGDTYKSLNEALIHGGLANSASVKLVYVDSETIETETASALLANVDAILVPGGFGGRGIEGKIAAIRYAREKKVPFFGICLGMQLAVVEYARNCLGLQGAMSKEFEESPSEPIVALMEDQEGVESLGGTMRLGAYPCELRDGSLAQRVYGVKQISERHRHRFEINPRYHHRLAKGALTISGFSPDGLLAEVVENSEHPWFLACQFHPEFKSKPLAPHPLFVGFVRAALDAKQEPGSA